MHRNEIKFDELQAQAQLIMEALKKAENKPYYLMMGNSGFRNKDLKANAQNIKYLFNYTPEPLHADLPLPEIHHAEDRTFCECPDFSFSKRKIIEKLGQAMSLELAIKSAEKLSGYIIMIDWDDILTARGDPFRSLANKISELANEDFAAILASSIFLVTNKPEGSSKEDFLTAIKADFKSCEEELENYIADEESPEIKKIMMKELAELTSTQKFRQWIIMESNKLVMIDPTDGGKSKKLFLDELSKLKPADSSRLNFDDFYKDALRGYKDFNMKLFINNMMDRFNIKHQFKIEFK